MSCFYYKSIVNHASYGDLISPFLVSSSHFCRNAQLTLLGNRIKHGLALYVCQVDKRNDVRNKAVESMEREIYEVETHFSNDKQYAHVNDTIEDVYENIIKKSYAIG
jgi:hypothetical protein